MSKHEARLTTYKDGTVYAMIVRIDRDGEESVITTYKARHFTNRTRAERSTAKYLNEHC